METKEATSFSQSSNENLFGIGGLLTLLMSGSLLSGFSSNTEQLRVHAKSFHEKQYGTHFNEFFAKTQVGFLRYKDPSGEERKGEHWSVDRIRELTCDKSFHDSVTIWDKYVAYNYTYAHLCETLSLEQITEVAYKLWFGNEYEYSKVWDFLGMTPLT